VFACPVQINVLVFLTYFPSVSTHHWCYLRVAQSFSAWSVLPRKECPSNGHDKARSEQYVQAKGIVHAILFCSNYLQLNFEGNRSFQEKDHRAWFMCTA